MSRRIIVGAAQMGPVNLADERGRVVQRLVAMLQEAAARGCRLVVFPELALTTFFPRYWLENQGEVDAYFETQMPGAQTQALFDTAKSLGVGFYLGYAELLSEGSVKRRFNTSILVDARGNIVGKYRKIHLPGHVDHLPHAPFQHLEKRYFEVGDLGFQTWNAFGGVIGMCICNDRRWPETFRVLGLQGVELVLLGFNTPTRNIHHDEPPHLRMFHHHIVTQAAAYQNATWIVNVAKCGYEDGHHLHGGTSIVAPTGEIVALASTEQDEVITYDVDLDYGNYIKRSVFDFARHRRVEHYSLITDRVGAQPPAHSA